MWLPAPHGAPCPISRSRSTSPAAGRPQIERGSLEPASRTADRRLALRPDTRSHKRANGPPADHATPSLGGYGGPFRGPPSTINPAVWTGASVLLVTLDRGRDAFGAGSGFAAHLVQRLPAGFAVRVGRRRGAVLLRAAHAQRALTGDLAGDARTGGSTASVAWVARPAFRPAAESGSAREPDRGGRRSADCPARRPSDRSAPPPRPRLRAARNSSTGAHPPPHDHRAPPAARSRRGRDRARARRSSARRHASQFG